MAWCLPQTLVTGWNFGRDEANDHEEDIGNYRNGAHFLSPGVCTGKRWRVQCGGWRRAERVPNTNGGAGAIGGGSVGGESRANLPLYPRARFATAAIGGDASFAPSSFLMFEQAVEVGRAELAPGKSLAQVAIENSATSKIKSRIEFVQDNSGKVVPLHR